MSGYVNFVKDFPERCKDILDMYWKHASAHGREVTLMLAVASAGLNIPHERLKKSDHPSGDRDRYESAYRQLMDLRKSRFLGSALWDQVPGSWMYGKITNDQGSAEDWRLSAVIRSGNQFERKFRYGSGLPGDGIPGA